MTDSVEATADIPLVHNKQVDRWIEVLTGKNRSRTRLWLERSGRYAPHIRQELRTRGMPEGLIYLAFIESGFSPVAHSRAGAAGLWQFIPETARRYGLEVSHYVDERRDPIKATSAALSYLQDLYDRFGSWYLAAAAYNTGENRVDRILREREQGRRGDDGLFWRIAPHLPRETRNYVPLMLAAAHIGRDPAAFGFHDIQYQQALRFETAWIPGRIAFEQVARAAGISVQAIRELNPHLRRRSTPPDRVWPLRIPYGSGRLLAQGAEALSRASAAASSMRATQRGSSRYHTVRRGENVTVIARRHGVSVKRVLALNGLRTRSRIYPGQRLRVR